MWKRIDWGSRALVVTVLVIAAAWPGQAAEIGEKIEFGRLAPHSGKALTDSRLQRKVTVVSLWASWCQVCKTQLTEMENELGKLRHHKDLQIAFVALDQHPETALAYFEQHTNADWAKWHLYFDPGLVMAEALEAQDFPMTVIIDKQGKIGFIQNGYEPGKGHTELLVSEVKQYLSLK